MPAKAKAEWKPAPSVEAALTATADAARVAHADSPLVNERSSESVRPARDRARSRGERRIRWGGLRAPVAERDILEHGPPLLHPQHAGRHDVPLRQREAAALHRIVAPTGEGP